MIKIENENILYTYGDTFQINVSGSMISAGDVLRFQITRNEQNDILIDRKYHESDNSFNVILSDSDINKLTIGEYVYRISIINRNNEIITRNSGHFIVKWGA